MCDADAAGEPVGGQNLRLVCPNPDAWHRLHARLHEVWLLGGRSGDAPPTPLILGGWWASNDRDKQARWRAFEAWARSHGEADLVADLLPSDWYRAAEADLARTDYWWETSCRRTRHPPAPRPTSAACVEAMRQLRGRWSAVAGGELAGVSEPVRLAGAKRRALVVRVEASAPAPWGGWTYLSRGPERLIFSALRSAVNATIAPLGVDHIRFVLRSVVAVR